MRPTKALLILSANLLAICFLAYLYRQASATASSDVGLERRLPDGSTLRLEKVIFAATNVFYSHQSGPRLLRPIAHVLPQALRARLNLGSGGSFGFGGDGSTNLFVITINRGQAPAPASWSWSSAIHRLRVSDGQSNTFDACWGANTLGMAGEIVHGWQIRAFPRRSRTLTLQFLAADPTNGWISAAQFHIPNPAFSDPSQWIAEPLPDSRVEGPLKVTLDEFQAGARMSGGRGSGDPSVAARKTRLVFSFSENAMPSDSWRVQKITFSDATANRWFPYLDFINQDFNWVSNGTVEFFGALWPGERAWKLDVEVLRTAGFEPRDLWEVPVDLPLPGQTATLTNAWEHSGTKVILAGVASPNTDLSGDLKWVAKWWGEDKHLVFSVGLRLEGHLAGTRLSLVQAVDERGNPVSLLEHRGQDYPLQALFFKPAVGATQLRLTLALQESHFFQFQTRPQLVGAQ